MHCCVSRSDLPKGLENRLPMKLQTWDFHKTHWFLLKLLFVPVHTFVFRFLILKITLCQTVFKLSLVPQMTQLSNFLYLSNVMCVNPQLGMYCQKTDVRSHQNELIYIKHTQMGKFEHYSNTSRQDCM